MGRIWTIGWLLVGLGAGMGAWALGRHIVGLPHRAPWRRLVPWSVSAVYAWLAWHLWPCPVVLVLYSAYVFALAIILVTDVGDFYIPNRVIYPCILVAGASALLLPHVDGRASLLGGLGGAGAFTAVALVGRAMFGTMALGWGDVKLAAFVGLVAGERAWVALVLSVVLGGIGSAVALLKGKRALDPIPYGPFLIGGMVAVLLVDALKRCIMPF
jgi:prepilin signal peptidase PulO-like enzyme (type II secretory pathway)